MKKFLFITAILLNYSYSALCDEGMWMLQTIENNYEEMKNYGFNLTPDAIYSINHNSMKDAVVHFGGGCTGEIISREGLLLTNHHCGFGAIQSQSSVEHDYLTNGFWAYSKDEELPIEGLTVKFLVRIEDYTERIVSQLSGTEDESSRNIKIKELSAKFQNEAVSGTHYEAVLKSFFDGNEFYMFVYEVYTDVRLVGAPPVSIGKFGAETDNWMWPRHTGDFSIFRVYCSKDGKPAAYSRNNVPLSPKHYFPINISGYKKNDFAMIIGFPGTTERYMTSQGIDFYTNEIYPARIAIRAKKLELMMEDMKADDAVRIKYASKYAGISNYWKNFIGVMQALDKLKVADKKKKMEDKFIEWCDENKSETAEYRDIFVLFDSAYHQMKKYNTAKMYIIEAIVGCEAMFVSRNFESLADLLSSEKLDQEAINKKIAALKVMMAGFYKDYNPPTDLKITKAMLSMYYKNVPRNQQPEFLLKAGDKTSGNFDKFCDNAFKKSIFPYQDKMEGFFKNPKIEVLSKDPLYLYILDFMDIYVKINTEMNSSNELLAYCKRLYSEAVRKMLPEKKFYPDANSTIRLTYGRVLDYMPADAVLYDYYTTLTGVMDKENPDNYEFVVPEKLKKLWLNKDFGEYAEDGQMKVCFLTDNDITGGNSGSPVINGKGELIGLAFDGNWEAMSGNILFESKVQRTINVDIRYVLFIIDKYANADNLISEMKIVR